MTTVFVIAAVLLGADGGKPAPVVKLQQPVVAEQAEPVVVILGVMPASQLSQQTGGGLIKPVGYEPNRTVVKKPITIATVSNTGAYSLLQDVSPSDSVSPKSMPTPPKAIQLQSMNESTISSSYNAEADYTVGSCGCDTSCESSCDSGCNSCGCHKAHGCNLGCQGGCHGGCHGCGHGHGGFYARHCLPSPWHAPGNMTPHIPYVAYPKTYYYFRPYNMLHIPDQQARASAWVENAALPYSNGIFDKVYAELEPTLNATGEEIGAGK
ncbi:hypothetical protein C5Y96_18610 [Blastopirellula marina]|uniref:Uncharacterized protein n=1 Tax=Blastopirellula marina TaxID=124 RepID=A0A2S8F5W6_9BACT|nr:MULTISPECIES: hypothetical protein [Pirellulaceae]PQO27542.1 hypothetical protein C5Y96_18610 [Blastopirellula marina]RCS48079.1 hypothetical protein DTL36_18635 [Bremerella cremea]